MMGKHRDRVDMKSYRSAFEFWFCQFGGISTQSIYHKDSNCPRLTGPLPEAGEMARIQTSALCLPGLASCFFTFVTILYFYLKNIKR